MSVYQPEPLCQFTDGAGQPWPPTTWRDGVTRDYNSVNCGPTSAAWVLAHQTRGTQTRTPPDMRFLTGDRQGGTATRDLAYAIGKAGGDVVYRRALPVERVYALLDDDDVAILLYHDYEYLRGASTFMPAYDGDHFLVLVGGTVGLDPGADPSRAKPTILAMDPIGELQGDVRRAAMHRISVSQAMAGAQAAAEAIDNPPGTVRCIVSRQVGSADTTDRLRAKLRVWRLRVRERDDTIAEGLALLRQAQAVLDRVPGADDPPKEA